LHAPEQVASVTHVVMRMGNFTEKRVVEIILAMQAVVSILVFSVSYFKLF